MLVFSVLNKLTISHKILYECCVIGVHYILVLLDFLISSNIIPGFDVLLTAHLIIFILVIKQLDAQNLFFSKFISRLYIFQAPCAHRQEVKIVLYTRGCIVQF